MEDIELHIRERIIHVLTIFPKISRSMLQVGIGTSIAPAMWKPLFLKMLEEGVIVEDQVNFSTPAGRHQTYSILRLKETTPTPLVVVAADTGAGAGAKVQQTQAPTSTTRLISA